MGRIGLFSFSSNTIAGYRRIAGGPRRGVLTPHPSTARMIVRIRKETKRYEHTSGLGLMEKVKQLKQRVATGESPLAVDVVSTSFALTCEALRRQTGMTFYDVQLAGGLVLAAGAIAEIQTGEGKTITASLPAVLHALTGRGVHVATTNDYLSQRDYFALKPVYESLGLTTGLLKPRRPAVEKQAAYAADITYGPGYEFGFDFLRDQVALRARYRAPLGERYVSIMRGIVTSEKPLTQRGLAFVIIDEADSVLIDEANTPLILSGERSGAATSTELYQYAREVAMHLNACDFVIDHGKRLIHFTDAGRRHVGETFAARPTGRLARPWRQLVDHALRAEHLLQRDVDYVILEGTVQIVDPNTGRLHDERTWSGGLHQAVEVKEQVNVTPESQTQARITRQRYLGFYDAMCGLTGTAVGSESELRAFYKLPVVRIPTHKPCRRMLLAPRAFATCDAKFQAIVDDVRRRSTANQPVLIGTRSIAESHHLSTLLKRHGIQHVVLNGLQDEEEASIVARAGKAGAVTVATNVAGRGTDIQLDEAARKTGGLHVIAAEPHVVRRVDRQLAGRAARQGDPGSCQTFVSADDRLIATHAMKLGQRIRRDADLAGEFRADVRTAIRHAQSASEQQAVKQRQAMVDHDQWLESVQRTLARRA